jgi:hypothetical protein
MVKKTVQSMGHSPTLSSSWSPVNTHTKHQYAQQVVPVVSFSCVCPSGQYATT